MNSFNFIFFLIIAGIFQVLMGANDGGVLLGSIISTNVVSPILGVIILFVALAVSPFIFGTAVVETLGTKILPPQYMTLPMLYGAIISTIVWVMIAQRIKYPVSISYTFVGALIGSALSNSLHRQLNSTEIAKVFGGLIASIVIGFAVSFLLAKVLRFFLRYASAKAGKVFRIVQVISSVLLVLGYGSNDAEKTLSLVYTATLITNTKFMVSPKNLLVIVALSFLFIIGTLFFGANSLLTAGFRLMKSSPRESFLAQTISSLTVLGFARLGFPVSSTETLNMSVVGIGVAEKPYGVKYRVVRNLVLTWIVTGPVSILLSFGITFIFSKI